MKLFLASLGITNELAPYFKSLVNGGRHSRSTPSGLIIENASDYKGREGQHELRKYYKILRDHGLEYEFLDLKKYKGKTNKLKAILDSADFVYVSGGNTFYLYYWVVESGFDQIIKKQIEDGLVYAGSSAGSVIAGQTLKYFDIADKIEISPNPDKIKWEGLKLVDFTIIPHWGEEKYKSRFNLIVKGLKKDNFKVKTLTNKQAFLVTKNEIQLISEHNT